jgi:hypothetical protein
MTARVSRPAMLEAFDRFVAEMRTRLEAERCSLSWGEDVSGEMSVTIAPPRKKRP